MIHIVPIALLWLTSPLAGFVCVNGHPTVDVEYHLRVVFIGTVISERYEPPTKQWDQGWTIYTVSVDEPLRGKLPKRIRLSSENSSGRFPMEVRTKYLLFAHRAMGRTSIDYCGNSEVYSDSSPTLRAVRRLKSEG